ncbi:MAG: tetratricopeptide repeat protein [Rhizomicrobium sp.]
MLAVFVAAAGMAFSKGVADGRRDAMHHIVRIVPRKALATAAATPLDRLSARAEAGDPPAEYAVATRYLHGTDTAGNPAEAMRWLTLAAAHGLPAAQYKLGTLYARGRRGPPADAGKALQWYEAAALQGNRKAMHDLAVAYAQGSGTARNLPEAVRWFSRAAGLGYVDSQFNLAVLYERGDGVPQSLLDAYKWYLVASRQGDAGGQAAHRGAADAAQCRRPGGGAAGGGFLPRGPLRRRGQYRAAGLGNWQAPVRRLARPAAHGRMPLCWLPKWQA